MGQLVPIGLIEALPGDSIQQSTSLLIRVSPLLAPVMHPVTVRIHHWFVPFRLIWDEWEQFITGGTDGEGDGYTFPYWASGTASAGDLFDYLGIPPHTWSAANAGISKLPFRAYNKVYNEFYRDQDLVTEVAEDSYAVQNVSWEKDRFTASRPWTQKGPDVTLPLGTSADVVFPSDVRTDGYVYASSGPSRGNLQIESAAAGGGHDAGGLYAATPHASSVEVGKLNVPLTGLSDAYADLSTATAATVNLLREAFAKQRYAEARAQYGSRYTEYLRFLGIRSSDARLQRPEYLGGGRQTISFSEVLQTGVDSGDGGVGTLRGHGIAAVRSNRYRRFFEEHGYVLSLLSVRPRTMYTQGVHRLFTRRTREDFYQRELERIGQEEVYKGEIYAQGDANDLEVFGYNDRYSTYRHIPSSVTGDFRSTLTEWHLGRILAAEPTLNQSFIECVPSKRIHEAQSADVLWVMASHSVQARRMVGRSGGTGRIF